MERRARFSAWLQRAAKPRVEAALRAGCRSLPQLLAQLVSGRQLGPAAAAAAAAGDVRLASLLAQAGQHAGSMADIGTQVCAALPGSVMYQMLIVIHGADTHLLL
jgi:hypothetical protein